jgi:hypothetical protein
MHIMDGSPAEFQDGHLVYCGKECGRLATSARQIYREQVADREWCEARGLPYVAQPKSYLRIKKSAVRK